MRVEMYEDKGLWHVVLLFNDEIIDHFTTTDKKNAQLIYEEWLND